MLRKNPNQTMKEFYLPFNVKVPITWQFIDRKGGRKDWLINQSRGTEGKISGEGECVHSGEKFVTQGGVCCG